MQAAAAATGRPTPSAPGFVCRARRLRLTCNAVERTAFSFETQRITKIVCTRQGPAGARSCTHIQAQPYPCLHPSQQVAILNTLMDNSIEVGRMVLMAPCAPS